MKMADNTVFAVIGILIAIFSFLLVLLAVGQYFGGSWGPVTQGVAKYILILTVFGLAAFALFHIAGRR